MEVQVSLGSTRGVSEEWIRSAVELVLSDAGIEEGEVSVALLRDEAIRGLNREYLARDRTTDVIAFALHTAGQPVVGDVYIGFDQAVRQAEDMSIPVTEEVARLVVHGVLHVLGHEHPESDQRIESEMFQLQERLVRDLLDGAS